MDERKRQRLERAGWRVGTVQEFLGLSDADAEYIEIKLRLAKSLSHLRSTQNYTQTEAAKLLGSSQSRIAKMEAGDASVSLDLLIRSMLTLGAKPRDLANAMCGGRQPLEKSRTTKRKLRARKKSQS